MAEGVWWVGCGGWGGTPQISEPGDANAFLVDCGGAAALIDAGGHDRAPEILANIARAGVEPKRVKAIFLTHAHHDHSAGAGWLRGRTGAKVYAGQLTARALAEREPLLIGAMKPFAKPRFRRMAADRALAHGKSIEIGRVGFECIHTPGHTIDSCCFVARTGGRRLLFSGDTLVGNQPRADFGYTVRGMLGWLDGHWGASLSTYISTLRKLLKVRPSMLLPGHGIPNDPRTTADSIRVGIRKLERIIKDRELHLMLAIEG